MGLGHKQSKEGLAVGTGERVVGHAEDLHEAVWLQVALRYDPAFSEGYLTFCSRAGAEDDGYDVLYAGSSLAEVDVTSEVLEDSLSGDEQEADNVSQAMRRQTAGLTADECFSICMVPVDETRESWRIIRRSYQIR